MRLKLPAMVEAGRVVKGVLASCAADGPVGVFRVRMTERSGMNVIASNGEGWEHVSVVRRVRKRGGKWKPQIPTWGQMCEVKGWFWEEEEAVVQFHPARSEYVNQHAFCLHLWRPTEEALPVPPSEMVGMKPGRRMSADGLEVLP